jgi:hypothetical protein
VTEAERVWGAYIDAWNTDDIDAIVEVVAEQFVYGLSPGCLTVGSTSVFSVHIGIVARVMPATSLDARCSIPWPTGWARRVLRFTRTSMSRDYSSVTSPQSV